MKRALPVLLILAALVAAVLLSRPKPASSDPNTAGAVTLEVSPLTLEGAVAVPPQGEVAVRVAALAGGQPIADAPVKDNRYSLSLPGRVTVPLSPLESVSLLHGDGRLQGGAKAADVTLLLYQDDNKNARYDSGEPKLEAALLPSGKNPNYQAFFKYKLLLLSDAAGLEANLDNPTGAKNFYRYDLKLARGYNILEGELASNGYEMRATQGTGWDLLLPLPQGGSSGPPTFTP